MTVKIVRKFGEPIHKFNVDGASDENNKLIPDLGDHVEIDEQRYIVVDRTFNLDRNEVLIQVWKPVLGEDFDF